ncbi:hypothetical protein B0H67DRAFT_114441 [Lasiosphaeris hirsuta]|uniref:Secreted protein n=1 Tax=Lasiosphaeris hirsuta TaxID=260670 RepID=A0AA40AZC5_9PEZI|nr:hypothetical protein B0H67DRAFT_114441 [Lasiosphaeris hirsuta]
MMHAGESYSSGPPLILLLLALVSRCHGLPVSLRRDAERSGHGISWRPTCPLSGRRMTGFRYLVAGGHLRFSGHSLAFGPPIPGPTNWMPEFVLARNASRRLKSRDIFSRTTKSFRLDLPQQSATLPSTPVQRIPIRPWDPSINCTLPLHTSSGQQLPTCFRND